MDQQGRPPPRVLDRIFLDVRLDTGGFDGELDDVAGRFGVLEENHVRLCL